MSDQQTRLKCAQCDEEALDGNPRLCAHHRLVFFAMLGSNLLSEYRSVHVCPFNDWSVIHNDRDLDGVEACIKDHLDTEHPGWTMEQLEDLMANFDHAAHDNEEPSA